MLFVEGRRREHVLVLLRLTGALQLKKESIPAVAASLSAPLLVILENAEWSCVLGSMWGLIPSLPNKMSAKFLVCFKFQSVSILLKFGEHFA